MKNKRTEGDEYMSGYRVQTIEGKGDHALIQGEHGIIGVAAGTQGVSRYRDEQGRSGASLVTTLAKQALEATRTTGNLSIELNGISLKMKQLMTVKGTWMKGADHHWKQGIALCWVQNENLRYLVTGPVEMWAESRDGSIRPLHDPAYRGALDGSTMFRRHVRTGSVPLRDLRLVWMGPKGIPWGTQGFSRVHERGLIAHWQEEGRDPAHTAVVLDLFD